MNRISTLLFCSAVLLFPYAVNATPIVSVYKDDLSLSAYTELRTLSGVTLSHSANYSGELLPTDREASVSSWAVDEPCNTDGTGCGDEWGHSATAEASTSANSIDLFTYSLFYPAPAPVPPASLPVWDLVTAPIQNSIADLSWVFSVNEDIAIDVHLVKTSGDGFASAYLKDKTTNVVLLDYLNPEGFDSIEDIVLLAGHKYALNSMAVDTFHDDDTEAYVDIYFSRDVIFSAVPEPSTLMLLAAGLAALGFNRKYKGI